MDPLAESMIVNNINTNNHVNIVKVQKIRTENNPTISLDIITGNCENSVKNRDLKETGIFSKLFLSFSWYCNYNDLISHSNISTSDITAIHGLKVFCLLWIILINTYTVIFHVADNKLYRKDGDINFIEFIVENGSFSIDTFFFLRYFSFIYL